MPELPEVQTVLSTLEHMIAHKRIESIEILSPDVVQCDSDEFSRRLNKRSFVSFKRRGKYLLFEMEDVTLVSHLRMEGKYFIKEQNESLNKHDHVIFILDNKEELRYNDTRKFGKMHLVKKDELNKTPLIKLGLEPWDNSLTPSYLKDKLNKNKAIKTLLLDQSIITGIGNIYADEILFLSKINPELPGNKLNNNNLLDIITNTQKVLEKAISEGGTTIHTYTSVDGITGRFQQQLLVHGKKDELCPNCQSKILKIVVNGRGTYYCPKCQKKKK